jgi:hypothetical protein
MIFTNRTLRNEKLDKAMMLKFGSENRVQLKKTIKTCKYLAKWCKKRRNELKTKEREYKVTSDGLKYSIRPITKEEVEQGIKEQEKYIMPCTGSGTATDATKKGNLVHQYQNLTEKDIQDFKDQHCAKVPIPDSIFNPFTKG